MMSYNPEDDRGTAAATGTEAFPLMKLPAELRNNIYGHYFARIEEAQWVVRSVRTPPETPWTLRFMPKTKISIEVLKAHLALLHANHEVRAEAGSMFYNRYLANTEFHSDIDYHNGPGNFQRIQAICASFAAFAANTETKPIEFGIRIFTKPADKLLLCDLADHMYKHAAWTLQSKTILQYRLKYIDGRIDNEKLTKLGLNAEEMAFLTLDLKKIPSFAELETDSAEHRPLSIPGLKVRYEKKSFQMFGILATIDWESFDVENVSWHLPSTDDSVEFVDEVLFSGGAALTDSDDEPEETSLLDTLELESDEDGEHTGDEMYEGNENMDALHDDDVVDHEDSDYFDGAT